MNRSLSHASHEKSLYDARLEADEDEARLDCGCLVARTDDGGFILSFCSLHAEAAQLQEALRSADAVFNDQHNLLSTATDAERRVVIGNTVNWWNHTAVPVLRRTNGLPRRCYP